MRPGLAVVTLLLTSTTASAHSPDAAACALGGYAGVALLASVLAGTLAARPRADGARRSAAAAAGIALLTFFGLGLFAIIVVPLLYVALGG